MLFSPADFTSFSLKMHSEDDQKSSRLSVNEKLVKMFQNNETQMKIGRDLHFLPLQSITSLNDSSNLEVTTVHNHHA